MTTSGVLEEGYFLKDRQGWGDSLLRLPLSRNLPKGYEEGNLVDNLREEIPKLQMT